MDKALVSYRSATLKIGKALSDSPEQLTDFKFLCRDMPGFTQRDVDMIADGRELIAKLEQIDVVSRDNVDSLAELLGYVDRPDLKQVLLDYKAAFLERPPVGYGSSGGSGLIAQPASANFKAQDQGYNSRFGYQNQPALGDDLTNEFDIIVENIGRDWRQLARRLGLSEVDIECITENHSRNLREQSRQALWMWKKHRRAQATRAALIGNLRKCRMNYIADIVEGYIQQ